MSSDVKLTIQEINESITLREAFTLAGLDMPKVGEDRKMLCPVHYELTPSAHIYSDSDTERIHCFACGETLSPFDILTRLGGLSFSAAIGKAERLLCSGSPDKKTQYQPPEKDIEFDYSLFASSIDQPKIGVLATERRFSESTLTSFKIGFDPDRTLYTFPILTLSGVQVSFISYNILADSGRSKYAFAKNFKKSKNFFFHSSFREAAKKENEVIICEGIFDVMRLFENGICHALATLGPPTNETLFDFVARLGVKKVTLSFDNDDAGKRYTSNALDYCFEHATNKKYDIYLLAYSGEDPDKSDIGFPYINKIFYLDFLADQLRPEFEKDLSTSKLHVDITDIVIRARGTSDSLLINDLKYIVRFGLPDEINQSCFDAITARQALEKKVEMSPFSFGSPEIDKIAKVPRGSVVIIGADSGVGKTSFLLYLLSSNASKKKFTQLFFSLEMNQSMIFAKMKDHIEKSFEPDEIFNFSVVDLITGLEQITSHIKKVYKAQADLETVYIDYVQCIDMRTQIRNELPTDVVAKELRKLALRLNIVIIVSSQITRESSKKHAIPEIYDLKGGGGITQDAAFIFLLHSEEKSLLGFFGVPDPEKLPLAMVRNGLSLNPRELYKKYRGKVSISLKKNRHGAPSEKEILLKFSRTGILEPSTNMQTELLERD